MDISREFQENPRRFLAYCLRDIINDSNRLIDTSLDLRRDTQVIDYILIGVPIFSANVLLADPLPNAKILVSDDLHEIAIGFPHYLDNAVFCRSEIIPDLANSHLRGKKFS